MTRTTCFIICIAAYILPCCSPTAGYEEEPDFITPLNLRVYVDFEKDVTRDSLVESFEVWEKKAIDVWYPLVPEWADCLDGIKGKGFDSNVYFSAQCPVMTPEKNPVASKGYTTYDLNIVLGSCGHDQAVFIHEIGHVIAYKCGGLWQESHDFFQEVGFRY